MSSPERRALMQRNVSRLTLLIQQMNEAELANSQRRARWEQWMQESDQRMQESDQRMQESDQRMRERDQRTQENNAEFRRLNEQDAADAEKIRALIKAAVEIQTDVARIDAAS